MSKVSDEIEYLNEVDKFILLLLGTKNAEPVRSTIHLQKEMYFMHNVFPELANELGYTPYLFGPFSHTVAERADEMMFVNQIKIEKGKISLTPNGKKMFGLLKNKVGSDVVRRITNFKEFLNDLTVDELLAFTYFTHETPKDFESKSVKYKELLSKRVKLAIAMFDKEKISAQRAAQIAGINIVDFLEELKV